MGIVTPNDGNNSAPLQVAIPDFTTRKAQLRNSLRQLPRGKTPPSTPVCDALERWLASQPGLATIAVFAALPEEVDLADLVARHPERCWVYPRICGDDLTFHAVTIPAAELTCGAFGIREPSPTLAPVATDRIDAFLCPGLAFDAHGGRLGRGRGYYDRVLAGARPDALKIGVCFARQIVPDTFPQPHDVRMDKVISG